MRETQAMSEPTAAPRPDDDDDDAPSLSPVPRSRPGYRTPEPSWSQQMSVWAPIVAAALRAITGVVAFIASLLAMPLHFATPFLVGVSLVMAVGGCTATLKVTRDDPTLRGFGRGFTLVVAVVLLLSLVVAGVFGAGAFAPDLKAVPGPHAPAVDDGTIRFEPVP
jgi:hypothetical protein